MILVTGTMRSGTSMWMQVMMAAGFEHIGEAFPSPWGAELEAANPRGFFESQFIAGIYYATNPQPETGHYLFPEQTRSHVVKVFIPGLLRTDVAFVDRVVATVRGFRQYAASVDRMRKMSGQDREAEIFDLPFSATLRWWMENFALVRDIATRRYPAHVTTYDRLLADPEKELDQVFDWFGVGDRVAAAAAVESKLRTQDENAVTPPEVEPKHAEVFDLLFEHIHEGKELEHSFVDLLNRTDRELRPQVEAARSHARDAMMRRLQERG